MAPVSVPASALRGCYVISLRPAGEHAAMRRAAAAHGARVLALSPWRLLARTDTTTREALRKALRAPLAIFTSPAAVRAATALQPLHPAGGRRHLAVGASTARALRRAGAAAPLHPRRMDSEGLLALPPLRDPAGTDIGLVTAPDGRSRLSASLRRRGARVLRADVYERVPRPPAAVALARLRALPPDAPLLLPLSSGLALDACLAVLPPDLETRLKRARVIAASARLAALARERGFDDVIAAPDARPHALIAAAAAAARPRASGRS